MKAGTRIKQVSGSYSTSSKGWLGTIRRIVNGDANVLFDNFQSTELTVALTDLAAIDRLEELLATVNASRSAIKELKENYSGQFFYNSPKFKSGKDHVCETFSKLDEFELVAKKKVKVLAPLQIAGLNVTMNEGGRILMGTRDLGLSGDVAFHLGQVVAGTAAASGGFTALRTGVSLSNGTVIPWTDAERLVTEIGRV